MQPQAICQVLDVAAVAGGSLCIAARAFIAREA